MIDSSKKSLLQKNRKLKASSKDVIFKSASNFVNRYINHLVNWSKVILKYGNLWNKPYKVINPEIITTHT